MIGINTVIDVPFLIPLIILQFDQPVYLHSYYARMNCIHLIVAVHCSTVTIVAERKDAYTGIEPYLP